MVDFDDDYASPKAKAAKKETVSAKSFEDDGELPKAPKFSMPKMPKIPAFRLPALPSMAEIDVTKFAIVLAGIAATLLAAAFWSIQLDKPKASVPETPAPVVAPEAAKEEAKPTDPAPVAQAAPAEAAPVAATATVAPATEISDAERKARLNRQLSGLLKQTH